MLDGTGTHPKRLPFSFEAIGGVGRLALADLTVGPLLVERLELEVTELGTDPASTNAERFQRRRSRLRSLAVRLSAHALDDRIEQVRRHLGGLGITQLAARMNDGFVSVRARAADGLAAADLSFRIQLVSAGTQLRALASTIRVHGHLPTPGPVIADRILSALLGATDAAGVVERPHARGLCDVEIDLVGALLWHLMPPAGWRLPAVTALELTAIKIGRGAIDIAYGPAGTRTGELGVRPSTHQLAAAHDLMHSVDQQLRDGHLEEAMRGYRALLASGGPDQPLLLERILALAAPRSAWFFDGLELARQALGRWPSFPPAHAALASITLAQGDAREAAGHLMQLAQLASADGDDDQAALAALAGARLLRVLDPKAATQLYQLALEHDPGSAEAADSLVDRLADEQRWPELVRLVRARAVTADRARAVQLRLRLADVLVHQLDDPASAQQELATARALAPDDPAVHEMTATILASSDPLQAINAWREVARLAEARGDHRTCARAWATLGALLAGPGGGGADAEEAWRRSLELDPLQADALVGLAGAAGARGDHAAAAELYERLRGLGLPQLVAARHELQLARSLVTLGRTDDARASLRRATVSGGETAAEAHAVLAEIAEATFDREHAAAELDTAIASLVDLATDDDDERLYTRAAQLAIARASLFDRTGQIAAASADYQRAHHLAQQHAPELARDAARTLLERSPGDDAAVQRRWIDAVLATRPPAVERASLLVQRADVRRRERAPDLAAALADLHEALQLTEDSEHPDTTQTRRRAYQLEAELLAQSGDQRARAQALASLAKMAERAAERVETETAAAAAWLAADEPAAALPHGARAHAEMGRGPDVPAALRREVLVTLGEAAWRQRAWPDVMRAYKGLIEDPGSETPRLGTFRYRLAVAADRSGDSALARATLAPLVTDLEVARAVNPELRGQALRLFADLAERAGDLAGAAAALESFAALAVDSSTTARADAMYRAGELFRRAEQPDDAIRCLEAALRISDTHLPALDALEAAWRERGDLERVSVILGRKVAATARHPARQKPLLSRLGDLQSRLGRPDVALATHQRALEIDPTWRPSLRYVTVRLRDAGQVVAAAGGLAQLAGELPNDQGVDLAVVARERQIAAIALAELVLAVDAAQLDAIREVAMPALERAGLDAPGRGKSTDQDGAVHDLALGGTEIADALGRLRGDAPRRPRPMTGEDETEDTQSGKSSTPIGTALSLRDAAARARASGKLDDALATLETANHVSPGDPAVLRELVELASLTNDHEAAARHLGALAELLSGARRGDALLELADISYDKLEDPARGRDAMRAAAVAFGSGARRDTTLRMLASEASTHLAWNIAVDALSEIAPARRSTSDFVNLATALVRAGRNADAIAMLEEATANRQLEDAGEILASLRLESLRKAELATALEKRAASQATAREAAELEAEAAELRAAVGVPKPEEPKRGRTKTDEKWPFHSTTPGLSSEMRRPSGPSIPIPDGAAPAEPPAEEPAAKPAEKSADESVAKPAEKLAEKTSEPPSPLFGPPPEAGDADVPPPVVSEPAPEREPTSDSAEPPSEAPSEDGAAPTAPPRTKTWPGTGAGEKPPAAEPSTDDAPTETTTETKAVSRTDAPTETPTVARTDAPSDATAPPVTDDAASAEPRAREPSTPPLARIKLVTRDSSPDLRAERLNVQELPPPRDPRSEDPDDGGWVSVSDPRIKSGPIAVPVMPVEPEAPAEHAEFEEHAGPSVVITGTAAEQATAVALAAMAANRDRLIAAYREQPDDPALLLAVLAHLGDREPALRLELLENAALTGTGRTAAIALHELGLIAREARDPGRAQTLWTRAHTIDPAYAPVWMPLADALAASDELVTARDLYERVAGSDHYDATRRAFAADRAEALGRDEAVVSGTIRPKVEVLLETARTLAPEDLRGAITLAEEAALNDGAEREALELLELLYLEAGDVTAASEAIGRQLMLDDDPVHRATLWRRRAKLYRDTLGRDAEAYRCLKEAHACSPADPEISYQLRTAAMVRGEWALAASLLYREIASAPSPRDRGALHLELALIYEERLDDEPQAQVNYEQALAFDPSIPAAKLPLARRYEAIGRFADAARLYEEAATTARPAERAGLLDAATRARTAATDRASENDLGAQLDRAEAMGDLDAALDLAHQLWRAEPGHAAAFRVLANVHRASGELAALTDLTSVRASRAELPEDRATAWLEVARLAEDVGALDQAARAYDLALIEDPGHIGALDARGALAFRLGDFATADLIYRDLGSGESVLGDDELALRRSIIAEQLGRDTEALGHARAAATAAPGRRDLVMRVQELATRVGDLDTALLAARSVLELIPLDDDETQLTTHFGLVELLRQAGDTEAAVIQLERILRDHPLHAPALEALAELQIARADWGAATRALYQLVPLAPTPAERAERLYRLGEAVLTHLGDTDRADDVFLRASDLDPTHLPTLRRLLDVYWRADDPGALVEVATELVEKNALASGPSIEPSLSRALIAAALVGDTQLTQKISVALGEAAPRRIAAALAELAGRHGRLQLASASTAIAELGRRGMLDLAKVRAAAAGTPVANVLSSG